MLQQMSELMMLYVQRIAVCDPAQGQRFSRIVARLTAFVLDEPKLASLCMHHIIVQPAWFQRLLCHEDKTIRMEVLDLIMVCLSSLRQHDVAAYAASRFERWLVERKFGCGIARS